MTPGHKLLIATALSLLALAIYSFLIRPAITPVRVGKLEASWHGDKPVVREYGLITQ